MKTEKLQYIITFMGLTLSVISIFIIGNYFEVLNKPKLKEIAIVKKRVEVPNIIPMVEEEPVIEEEIITTKPIIKEIPTIEIGEEVIFEGLTLTELTNKLNKNLYSDLKDTGHYFANYTKATGLDPYLAVAIVLQETGCKWGCSALVKNCNNIGGMKGTASCNDGPYRSYPTLEDGIKGYLDMVYNNYYSKGLTTPELMNPKYASSTSWAEAVNKYINTIRES